MKKKYISILLSALILLPLMSYNNILHIQFLKNLGGVSYYYEETSDNLIA